MGLALPLADFAFTLASAQGADHRVHGRDSTISRRPGSSCRAGRRPQHRLAVAVRRAARDATWIVRIENIVPEVPRVKLWATSDLHVGYKENRARCGGAPGSPRRLADRAPAIRAKPPAQLDCVLRTLTPSIQAADVGAGNHDLWTPRDARPGPARRGALRTAGRPVPELRRPYSGRSVRQVAGRRSAARHRADCSCSLTIRSGRHRVTTGAGGQLGVGDGRAIGGRGLCSRPIRTDARCVVRQRGSRPPKTPGSRVPRMSG